MIQNDRGVDGAGGDGGGDLRRRAMAAEDVKRRFAAVLRKIREAKQVASHMSLRAGDYTSWSPSFAKPNRIDKSYVWAYNHRGNLCPWDL